MNESYYVIETAEDILRWNEHYEEFPELTYPEAELIYSELRNNEVELMADQYGTLFWKQDGEEPMKMMLDDVIDQISAWNYRDIYELRDSRMEADSYDDYWDKESRYKQLKEKEKQIDRLFEKTSMGRRIRLQMHDLAVKTADQVRMIPILSTTIKPDDPIRRPAAVSRQSRKGMVI